MFIFRYAVNEIGAEGARALSTLSNLTSLHLRGTPCASYRDEKCVKSVLFDLQITKSAKFQWSCVDCVGCSLLTAVGIS